MRKNARAVLEALLPSGGHPSLPGLFETGFEEFLREFHETALLPMRLGFRTALWVGAWIAPLLILKLPPISRLSPEDRERALDALGKSRVYLLRQMLLLLKAVACFGYGADAKVRQAVGFPDR